MSFDLITYAQCKTCLGLGVACPEGYLVEECRHDQTEMVECLSGCVAVSYTETRIGPASTTEARTMTFYADRTKVDRIYDSVLSSQIGEPDWCLIIQLSDIGWVVQ